MPKQTKVITKRKKFIGVEIPLIKQKIELIGDSIEEIIGRTIKLDLTRQLKGKSVEVIMKIKNENGKLTSYPVKIRLMPYFIRRIIRKRTSFVEDSFKTPSQNSLVRVKPFLITRKKVSREVRKTLRNKTKNWLEDYIAERTDEEIFNEVLSNKLQKPLSLMLKKTYPLSMCEIRVLEIIRELKPEEVPKIKLEKKEKIEEEFDQMKEIEEEKRKKAEEVKQTQQKAAEFEKEKEKEIEKEIKEIKKKKKTSKKEIENIIDKKEDIQEKTQESKE